MPKCDFNKVIEIALWHGCSPVKLLHTFRTPFPKNTFEGLFLYCLLYCFGKTHLKRGFIKSTDHRPTDQPRLTR